MKKKYIALLLSISLLASSSFALALKKEEQSKVESNWSIILEDSIYDELVDFVFNQGTINGISFDDLKDETKEKTLILLMEFDNKLEEEFPGYKEFLKEKYSKLIGKSNTLKESLEKEYEKSPNLKKIGTSFIEFKDSLEDYINEDKNQTKIEKAKEKVFTFFNSIKK